MTGEEQTSLAREMVAIVRSRIPEGEQVARAIVLGQEWNLDPEESILQLEMARVYIGPELELEDLELEGLLD